SGARIVSADSTIEGRNRLPAAVRRLVQHLVVPFTQIDRLQDVEVERILDLSGSIPRRKLDVDDNLILCILRIQLAKRLPDDLLVLPDTRPRVSAERRRLLLRDLDLLDLRLCR